MPRKHKPTKLSELPKPRKIRPTKITNCTVYPDIRNTSQITSRFCLDMSNYIFVLTCPIKMMCSFYYDVITDNVISSSARRRRKCWSEVQHRESIEELFDRMTSSTNTPPVVDMDTDEVTGVAGEHTEDEEHDRRENCCKYLLGLCTVCIDGLMQSSK